MSTIDDLIADDDDLGGSDLVKQLRSALKAQKKELADAKALLEQSAKASRSASLADVFKDKGLDAKAVKLYPADADATAEAVDAWLGEFGDLFGIQQGGSTATPEEQAAAQRLSNVAAGAPPASQATDVQSLIAEMQSAKTQAELDAVYAKLGMK